MADTTNTPAAAEATSRRNEKVGLVVSTKMQKDHRRRDRDAQGAPEVQARDEVEQEVLRA